jgi:toxin ParE1/3/4
LEEIWRFTFTRWSRAQADAYYDDLTAAFVSLAEGRRQGRPLDDIKPGYLSIACGSHFIIYARRKQIVEIIRILHQRMNIGRHL